MKRKKSFKTLLKEAYTELAPHYARLIENKPENAYYERPATLSLLPDIDGKRILDVGCGTGVYTEILLNKGAHVTAIDNNREMIKYARQRLQKRAEILLADVEKPLDYFKSKSFHIIICPLVLDYIKSWSPVFREFNRILRTDGIFIFSIDHPITEFHLRGKRSYYNTEVALTTWTSFGVRVEMPTYRRPLRDIFSFLSESGFVLETFLEPRPLKKLKAIDSQYYDKMTKMPGFLCIKARKRN